MDKKQKRQQKLIRQQEMLNRAKEEGRDLAQDEKREFETLQEEIENLTREIEEEEGAGQEKREQGRQEERGKSETDMQRGVEVERERIRSITAICREFGMDGDEYIKRGNTIEQVREAVLDHIRKN